MKNLILMGCFTFLVGSASLAFSKEIARSKKIVSPSEFAAAIKKLNGKSIGPPITADGIVCHKVGRVNYFILTGMDTGRSNNLFCHNH